MGENDGIIKPWSRICIQKVDCIVYLICRKQTKYKLTKLDLYSDNNSATLHRSISIEKPERSMATYMFSKSGS